MGCLFLITKRARPEHSMHGKNTTNYHDQQEENDRKMVNIFNIYNFYKSIKKDLKTKVEKNRQRS